MSDTGPSESTSLWDQLDSVLAAPRSPDLSLTPLGNSKRARSSTNLDESSEDEADTMPLTAVCLNKNLVQVARRIATHKKLRTEQFQEVESFAAVRPLTRHYLFAHLIP